MVLLYAVELEVLEGLEAPGRADVMKEAAEAYRARAAMQEGRNQPDAARADRERAGQLEADARKLTQTGPGAIDPSGRVEELARQVETLRKQLDELQSRSQPSARHQAGFGPEPSSAVGRLQLVNAWGAAVTVVVDGVAYPLAAGQTRTLSRSAGRFTYEVRGVWPSVERTLAPGETFTVRIGPTP